MKRISLLVLLACSTPSSSGTHEGSSQEDSAVQGAVLGLDVVVDDVEELQPEEAPQEEPEVLRPAPEVVGVAAIRRDRPEERPTEFLLPSEEDLEERSVEALLRVCVNEEGWSSGLGCKAIWQVARQVRACVSRDGTHAVRCRSVGSTGVAAPPITGLWQISPRASGVRASRSRRTIWTSHLTTSCEEPHGWPTTEGHAPWTSYRRRCASMVRVIRQIVRGRGPEACPRSSRPIAWGCDPTRREAQREVLGIPRPQMSCNDTGIARRRGLQRLNCGETNNAFWCRPGTPHCNTIPPSERILRQRNEETEEHEALEQPAT